MSNVICLGQSYSIDKTLDNGKERIVFYLLNDNDTLLEVNDISVFERKKKKILLHYRSIGYPFSRIELQSSTEGMIYNLMLGDKIIYDSLSIKCECKMDAEYWAHRLSLKLDQAFNNKTIKKSAAILNEQGYTLDSSKVVFALGRAFITLFVSKSIKNSLSAALGFNDVSALRFTGVVDVNVFGVAGKGGSGILSYRNTSSVSRLVSSYVFKGVGKTSLGFGAAIDFAKRDTLFSKNQIDLSLGNQFQSWFYGFSYSIFNSFEQEQNISKKGGSIWVKKKQVELLLGGYRYEDSKINQVRFEFSVEQDYARIMEDRIYFFSRVHSKLLWGSDVSESEKSIWGGAKSMRGKLENSLFSSAYQLLNQELVLNLAGKDQLFIFYDVGLHEFKEIYQSVGLGFELDVGKGVFSIAYAAPVDSGSVSFNESILHLGLDLLF